MIFLFFFFGKGLDLFVQFFMVAYKIWEIFLYIDADFCFLTLFFLSVYFVKWEHYKKSFINKYLCGWIFMGCYFTFFWIFQKINNKKITNYISNLISNSVGYFIQNIKRNQTIWLHSINFNGFFNSSTVLRWSP